MQEFENTFALAVETSGRIGSVALGQGSTVLYESTFSGLMKHSIELFDTLESLTRKVGIRPDQIGYLYVTAGPGSFTGIRIAVTLAKMMSYAVKTRIVAVDTLDALAENATVYCHETGVDLQRIATILDAKQNRFFTAVFEQKAGNWTKIYPSSLLYPEELLTFINKDAVPVGLLGEGLVYYADRFACPVTRLMDEAFWPATARGVYAVGQRMAKQNLFSDIYQLVPAYIRKPDALEKWEQKQDKHP